MELCRERECVRVLCTAVSIVPRALHRGNRGLTAASTEVEAQSQQHPRPTDTGKQSAPKRRKLAHPNDEADVALLSTGLFYVEEEDAAPDAEIAAYQEERRLTAHAKPLDFWRCNSSRYPVLSRMVGSTHAARFVFFFIDYCPRFRPAISCRSRP
jgi:hypothetical protein